MTDVSQKVDSHCFFPSKLPGSSSFLLWNGYALNSLPSTWQVIIIKSCTVRSQGRERERENISAEYIIIIMGTNFMGIQTHILTKTHSFRHLFGTNSCQRRFLFFDCEINLIKCCSQMLLLCVCSQILIDRKHAADTGAYCRWHTT